MRLQSKMPTTAPNYLQTLAAYRHSITTSIASGDLRPFTYPYHFFGLSIFFVYLLISHKNRPWLYKLRWVVWSAIVLFEVGNLRAGVSSTNMAHTFAAGLVSAWDIVWATTMLIFNDPQEEFKRVEVRKGVSKQPHESSEAMTSARENGSLTNRTSAKSNENQTVKKSQETQEPEYYWQSYPENMLERIDWLADLLLNFRGPGWNWAIPTLPALPPVVKAKLGEEVTKEDLKAETPMGVKRFMTRRELLRDRLPKFIVGYFVLDLMKTVMMMDPYFYLGPNKYALPTHIQSLSPLAILFYRELLSLAAIIVSLEMVFMMAPLLFSCILGPKVLGLRGEAWYYPSTWNSSLDPIFKKGLNGLWGSWWHQTFRFAFAAPTQYFIAKGWLSPRSMTTKITALIMAFGISGILHAGGSLSQPVATKPLDSPIFFMLQALGIIIQTTFTFLLRSSIKKMPVGIRRASNFMFTFSWLFITAPFLIDDFARGGIWLYEPIPLSLLRGLGFGIKEAGWWCWDWDYIGISWHTGKHWWESGIAL